MKTLSVSTFLQFTAQELNVSVDSLNENTPFKSIPTWSSLNALIYLSRIHAETGVLLTSTELAQQITLLDLHQLITNKQHGAY